MDKLVELKNRHTLCTIVIRTISEMADDPRQPEALAHYRAQQDELNLLIADEEKAERQRLGLPEPEPVVVGLQPALLVGKALS